MRDTSLLQLALGLVPPWAVIRSEFDAEARQLDIYIDFAAGSRFACPSCGAADCPAYDTQQMSWRHLNFFQHQAFLHARVPRVHCTGCGIKTLSVPWARPDSGFTLLFEALIMSLVSAMPVNTVARLIGEHDTRLWRVIHHYVDRARAKIDLSTVRRLAIPRVKPEGRLRPRPGEVTTTSRCLSISTRPAWCSRPKARTPRRSQSLPTISPRTAAIRVPLPRCAST